MQCSALSSVAARIQLRANCSRRMFDSKTNIKLIRHIFRLDEQSHFNSVLFEKDNPGLEEFILDGIYHVRCVSVLLYVCELSPHNDFKCFHWDLVPYGELLLPLFT